MPSMYYPLAGASSRWIEVSWDAIGPDEWKNIVVRLDGQPIGTVAGKKELEAGQTLFLPSGSVLGVQLLGPPPYETGLRLILDGELLPGSVGQMSDSARLAKQLDGVFWIPVFFGTLLIILGLLSVFDLSDFLDSAVRGYGLSPVLIVFGLAQLALTLPIRRRSVWALATLALLLVIEGVVGGYLVAQSRYPYHYGTTVGVTGVVLQVAARVMMLNVIPLSWIVRGMISLRRFKQLEVSTSQA